MTLQNYEITDLRIREAASGPRRESRFSLPDKAATRLLQGGLRRYGALLGFFALWQLSSSLGWINPAVFPGIDAIVRAFYDGLVHGGLLEDIAISLRRAGLAFAAAILVTIPLGLLMGSLRRLDEALDPILQLFRQTSALALYPVFILLLGLGEASKIFVIFWGAAFPLLLSTIGGVRQVDGKLVEMARVFGVRGIALFWRVVLPASLPSIFVGLRLSATFSLLMLIAAEMIGASHGIGFQVMNAQYNFQIPLMFAAIGLLAGLGLLSNFVLTFLERRFLGWGESKG